MLDLQASTELAAAAGEVRAALASMHGAVANDSAEIQREWAKYMQKVRVAAVSVIATKNHRCPGRCTASEDLFSFSAAKAMPLRSQQLRRL